MWYLGTEKNIGEQKLEEQEGKGSRRTYERKKRTSGQPFYDTYTNPMQENLEKSQKRYHRP